MHIDDLHAWDITPAEAIAVQRELAGRVVERPPARFKPRLVAAADVSCNRFSSHLFAAVVVMKLPGFEIIETRTAEGEALFPYVPGLLSFREVPVVMEAFRALETVPDAVMFDGQGRAHPRRFGLACHAGLLLGVPSFGVAKSLLIGDVAEPGAERGSYSDIVHGGEVIGAALRTRNNVKPVYVSIGHMINLSDAHKIALECAPRTRIPEPARAAHAAANDLRRRKSGRK